MIATATPNEEEQKKMPYRAEHVGRERVETMMYIYYNMFKHLHLTLFDCCSKCDFDQISTSAQSDGHK